VSEEIVAPPAEDPAPPPPPAPAEEAVEAAPPAAEPDAVEDDVIEIPTGEKLVPLSALTAAREKAKSERAEKNALAEKAARADKLEQQLQAAAPYIEAARAMLEAKQRPPAPAQPEGPTADETAELQEIARDFDFYKGDGSLDLEKAARHQKRVASTAEKIAQQQSAPLVERTLSQDANYMLARAKATTLPNGDKADPDILDHLWKQIAAQPGGLQTLANQESVVHLWDKAYAATMRRKATQPAPKAPAEQPPPALFIEKAGGKEPRTVSLTDGDRRLAKDLGMTEKQYQDEVAKMPAGWGGR
jgi:hypothetical protein